MPARNREQYSPLPGLLQHFRERIPGGIPTRGMTYQLRCRQRLGFDGSDVRCEWQAAEDSSAGGIRIKPSNEGFYGGVFVWEDFEQIQNSYEAQHLGSEFGRVDQLQTASSLLG